jgi:hypothetical protein
VGQTVIFIIDDMGTWRLSTVLSTARSERADAGRVTPSFDTSIATMITRS